MNAFIQSLENRQLLSVSMYQSAPTPVPAAPALEMPRMALANLVGTWSGYFNVTYLGKIAATAKVTRQVGNAVKGYVVIKKYALKIPFSGRINASTGKFSQSIKWTGATGSISGTVKGTAVTGKFDATLVSNGLHGSGTFAFKKIA